jgi:multimeric flavodoxin WrbA
MAEKLSDQELMEILKIDAKTLDVFKAIRANTIKEAEKLFSPGKTKIKVLGISGSARDEFDMAQEKSNSESLLEQCLARCEKLGAKTELIPLRKYNIQHCKACYSTVNTQCHFYCSCYPKGTPAGDDMTNILYDKIIEADALIFATPVNNFKLSTLMAAFLDRCISLDGSLEPANPKAPKDKALNIKHMKFIELTADNDLPGSGLLRRFLGKAAGVIATGHEEGASMVISNLFMALNHFGMIFPPFSNMYAMSTVCKPTYEDKKTVLSDCYREEVELLAENIITAVKISRDVRGTDWKYDYKSN